MKRFFLSFVCSLPLVFTTPVSFSHDSREHNDQLVSTDEYGPVNSVETFWAISTKLRPNNSVSVLQTMTALYKKNRSVFADDNIHKIIPGSTLHIPSVAFIQQQVNSEAMALINKYDSKNVATHKKSKKLSRAQKSTVVVTAPLEKQEPIISESISKAAITLSRAPIWTISAQLKPDDSVSVGQTMVALYKKNQSSFINGDINKLIPNSILDLPSVEFIQQQSNTEAAALIKKYRNSEAAVQEGVVVSSQTGKQNVVLESLPQPNIEGTKSKTEKKLEMIPIWDLSVKLRPDDSVSVPQTMLALYKKNPFAFVDGNLYKLIPDAISEVPSTQFIKLQTNSEAIKLINKYRQWHRTQKGVVTAQIEKVESVMNVPASGIKENMTP